MQYRVSRSAVDIFNRHDLSSETKAADHRRQESFGRTAVGTTVLTRHSSFCFLYYLSDFLELRNYSSLILRKLTCFWEEINVVIVMITSDNISVAVTSIRQNRMDL